MEQKSQFRQGTFVQPESHLLRLIPKSISIKCSYQHQPDLSIVHDSINLMPHHQKPEELNDFFRELGLNRHFWSSLPSYDEKIEYVFRGLDKNIAENVQKVNTQLNNYLASIKKNKENIRLEKNGKQQEFSWLNLNTKNDMLKPKLKTKLVQSINQYKNQKKLREAHGKVLEQSEKVSLSDDSFDLQEEDSLKMNYEWSRQDEQIFLNNIKKVKEKFTKTQFLKNCHRYKFITNHQLCTLASQEISRKLDKSTKAFLSRQFLLDKYFSTKQNLTEKQMKFILKTSPLLGTCVDKAFVRAAIKNIRYEDIDKMQLQIAEQIIKKFELIRTSVKNSRKDFKHKNNLRAKQKIQKFQQKSSFELERAIVRQELQKHKVKMLRKLNYKSTVNQKKDCYSASKKMAWPVPMNCKHPSTGLFIRECANQQYNEDFNLYEKSYMQYSNKDYQLQSPRSDMIRFYSGGPLQNNPQNFIQVNKDIVKMICDTFKTVSYHKQICQKLDSIDVVEDVICDRRFGGIKTTKTITDGIIQVTKRTKKSGIQELCNNETEKAIKQRILQKQQKSSNAMFVKKLLTLAAENSFLSLKALNPKLNSHQINTCDQKGNTALFYAIKHRNLEFIQYLLGKKADVNIRCSKGLTPLHLAFKTNDYSLICKCLTSYIEPNLNSIDDQSKTPLYYSSRKILQMLKLEDGVVIVENKNLKFDNNIFLKQIRQANNNHDELEGGFTLKKYGKSQYQIQT